MLVLGIQGSPRKNGNTNLLLSSFINEAKNLGAHTLSFNINKKKIIPCDGGRNCEKSGKCFISDDMNPELYSLLWEAEVIVMATPIFFYTVPAQLKSLIDRSQALWSRKYMLKLDDPGRKWRHGFMLAQGATKGKNLFTGINLTARYFFDAIGANYDGSLEYLNIEDSGDIVKHPSAIMDAKEKAGEIIKPLLNRKKILFVCRENACRSQISAAFTQIHAGDKLIVMSGGNAPANEINIIMKDVMAENGIDMAFRKPQSIDDATLYSKPDIIITMGCEVSCPVFPGAELIQWDLPDPAGKPKEFMRNLRDKIEGKVKDLIMKL